MGYHYEAEKSKAKAYDARNTALVIAKELLANEQFKDQKKETLYIMAAMYHYTDRKDSALICLTQADKCTYRNDEWKKDNAEGLDQYLSEVIKLYKDIILKDEKIE